MKFKDNTQILCSSLGRGAIDIAGTVHVQFAVPRLQAVVRTRPKTPQHGLGPDPAASGGRSQTKNSSIPSTSAERRRPVKVAPPIHDQPCIGTGAVRTREGISRGTEIVENLF